VAEKKEVKIKMTIIKDRRVITEWLNRIAIHIIRKELKHRKQSYAERRKCDYDKLHILPELPNTIITARR
jgi:hypothetical protein